MKKIIYLFAIGFAFLSCNNDDDVVVIPQDVLVNFNFTQNWDGAAITNADYEVTSYTNANGEQLTLSKLVYLISDVTFTNAAGQVFDAGDYNLIDARNGTNTSFTPNLEIPEGDYNVSFTYGFDDEDNQDGVYLDLNSADGAWNVPGPLGGGYHFMRLEGKYINTMSQEVAFQFHNIRANTQNPPVTTDTSINVDLGQITIGDNTNIEIKMNVAEWFKNPNQWDLNVLFEILMPNFDAQIMMNENGQNVFSKGTVTQ